jgi:hypothetical protein
MAASAPKLPYDPHLSSLAAPLQCGIQGAAQETTNWQVDNGGVRAGQMALVALRGTSENHVPKLFKIGSRRKRWNLGTMDFPALLDQ